MLFVSDRADFKAELSDFKAVFFLLYHAKNNHNK